MVSLQDFSRVGDTAVFLDESGLDLIDGNLVVLDRRDLAKRAALDGFRQGVALAAKIVADMAADENSDLLREAETRAPA